MITFITIVCGVGVISWVAFAVSRSVFWQKVYGAIGFGATAIVSLTMATFVLLAATE